MVLTEGSVNAPTVTSSRRTVTAMAHVTDTPGSAAWHSWQSDAGQWWATRRGRWQQPMTLGPARDRAELAAILEREDGCQPDGRPE